MTLLQLDASANAPCTRTTVGLGVVEAPDADIADGITANNASARITRTSRFITARTLVIAAAEDRQEQQENVEDVKEDRRCKQRRSADVLLLAQPLEVERREAGEDHKSDDRVDERSSRDLHENEHDPNTISTSSAQKKYRASGARSRRVA